MKRTEHLETSVAAAAAELARSFYSFPPLPPTPRLECAARARGVCVCGGGAERGPDAGQAQPPRLRPRGGPARARGLAAPRGPPRRRRPRPRYCKAPATRDPPGGGRNKKVPPGLGRRLAREICLESQRPPALPNLQLLYHAVCQRLLGSQTAAGSSRRRSWPRGKAPWGSWAAAAPVPRFAAARNARPLVPALRLSG